MDKSLNRLNDSDLELVNGGTGCGVDDEAARREQKNCPKCGLILDYEVLGDKIFCGLCQKDITDYN